MIYRHQGKAPNIDPSAYIAPNATICGEVSIGPHARVMHGAQLIAEDSPIHLGANCIVLENAVIRGTAGNPVSIGENCLIGPQAHLVGCTLEEAVFVATGAAIFHGAWLGKGSEVRVHAVVHLKTQVPAGTTVPISWVAVGNPMQLFPPDQHDAIWEVQQAMNFPKVAYGLKRTPDQANLMPQLCSVMAKRLQTHLHDESIS